MVAAHPSHPAGGGVARKMRIRDPTLDTPAEIHTAAGWL